MNGMRIRQLSKTYRLRNRAVKALDGIDLDVEASSFVTVVGKSGCGKTTLLRILSGLEEASSGEVGYTGTGGDCTKRPKISIVFQEPRLMPWLTVKENVLFSVKKGKPSAEQEDLAMETLEMLGLADFKDAFPRQISGGMAQRAALGRTLFYGPDIILMDEPLGALDAYNRRVLQEELVRIFRQCGKTILFVTHDIDEAVFLGQKLVVMGQGKVLEVMDQKGIHSQGMDSGESIRRRGRVLDLIMGQDKPLAMVR